MQSFDSGGVRIAYIDEGEGELIADGPLDERRGDRGIDAAGQPADYALVADLDADRVDRLVHDVDHGPGGAGTGYLVQEVLEDGLTVLGVQHLRMPLHAGEPATWVFERRDRRAR